METKKEENRNFSGAEIDLLLNLIKEHKEILENRKTDAITNQKKEDCWLKLTEEFNKEAIGCYRSYKTLRTKYYNLKKGFKKMAAAERRELYGIGESPPIKKQFTDKNKKLDSILHKKQMQDMLLMLHCDDMECDGASSSAAIKAKCIVKKIEKELEYMAVEHKLKVEILELEKKERQLRIKEMELRMQEK